MPPGEISRTATRRRGEVKSIARGGVRPDLRTLCPDGTGSAGGQRKASLRPLPAVRGECSGFKVPQSSRRPLRRRPAWEGPPAKRSNRPSAPRRGPVQCLDTHREPDSETPETTSRFPRVKASPFGLRKIGNPPPLRNGSGSGVCPRGVAPRCHIIFILCLRLANSLRSAFTRPAKATRRTLASFLRAP